MRAMGERVHDSIGIAIDPTAIAIDPIGIDEGEVLGGCVGRWR